MESSTTKKDKLEPLKIGKMIFLPAHEDDKHYGKYAVPGQVRSRHGLQYKQKYADIAWIKDRAEKLGLPLRRVKPPRWD